MKDEISQRVIQEACYIIQNRSTVRDCGKFFGISKSTVHKDVTQRLISLSKEKYALVREVLEENKALRHIRGGIATKNKYKREKKANEAV